MNRKELSEIRNHFNPEAKYFTMERIITGFVDMRREVHGLTIRRPSDIFSAEIQLLYETMKKVLNLNLGKQSTELPFRNHAYGEDGIQTFLSALVKSDFKDEGIALDFLNKLAAAVDSEEPYAVIAAICQYDPPRRNKMGELDPENSTRVFRYIVTALCPVSKADGILVYSSSDEEILRQENPNAVLHKVPAHGFFYPVFTDRSADVHHVMYYSKSPNEPCENLINAFLECEPESTVEEEQCSMKEVLDSLLGEELTYETVTAVNEKMNQIAAKNKTDEAPTEITGRMLHRMLAETGVPEEKLAETEKVFDEHIETTLKPERLAAPKTVIKTPEIVVNIKNDAKDKVRFDVVAGRRCMIIELDEAMVEVNGYDVKLPSGEPTVDDVPWEDS